MQSSAVAKKNVRRRRVKTAVACLLVGLLLAVPAVFVNTAIGYFPAMAFCIALVLLFVYVQVQKRGLVFSEGGVGRGCLRGEKMYFSLDVSNKSLLPAVSVDVVFYVSDLFGGERESVSRRLSLLPRSSKTFDFALVFDHIGTYEMGIRSIDVSDPFGVFHHVKLNDELQEVSVQPRLSEIAPLNVSVEAQQEAKRAVRSVISDGMDYCGVREYRWGDPIKAIHWKLSARNPGDVYYTRLYEVNSNPGVSVFVDTASLDYDAEGMMSVYDAVVESALSVEAWASSCGYDTDVMFLDTAGDRARIDGPLLGRYDDFLERLPKISAGDGRALLEFVRMQSALIHAKNNFVVCTACLTEELVGELLRVRTTRICPMLVAIVPPGLDDGEHRKLQAMLGRLSSSRIDYALVAQAADLEGRD